MSITARGRLSLAILEVLPPKDSKQYMPAIEVAERVQAMDVKTDGIHSVLAGMRKRDKVVARKNRVTKRLEYALNERSSK